MSTYIRLGNLFELYSIRSDGLEVNEGRYTNACEPGRRLTYNDKRYTYLSFIYQGAAKNRTGDNIQAGLMLSTNPISTGLARRAVNNRWHMRVYSVTMNPTNDEVSRLLTVEDWLVASLSYDPEAVEVQLSSGIDAVGANAPNKVLTRNRVGSLPVTANIQAR